MKNLKFVSFVLLLISMFILSSCDKSKTILPVADFSANVTTIKTDSTVSFTDLSSGNPIAWTWSFDGGTPATSTAQNPTVQYHTAGTYKVTLTVTNTDGSNTKIINGYITVTTTAPQRPVVSTTAISSITNTTAVSGGTITSQGSSAVTARGVCWSTNSNPTISNNKTTDSVEIGNFTSHLTGLKSNTTYYVRAYATNGAGTAYGDDISFTTTQPKLFVCGTEWSSSESMQRAKLWVNGRGTFLGDGIESFAQGIAVTDAGDVYVAGSVKSSNWRAVYWKNNVANYLTYSNGSTYAVANAVSVSNSDVYTAGYETNMAGKKVAKYWKNNTAVSLTDGTYNAEALSILVYGSNVYTVGYENAFDGMPYPKLWINGTESSFQSFEGIARGLFLSGSNTYIVGEVGPITNTAGAVYWLNGMHYYLSANVGSANSIYIVGSDVYIAGYNSNNIATYWKNGTAVPLETNSSTANSIFVTGNDVYVAGKMASNDICYWKNGIRTILSTTNNSYNKATGIVYK